MTKAQVKAASPSKKVVRNLDGSSYHNTATSPRLKRIPIPPLNSTHVPQKKSTFSIATRSCLKNHRLTSTISKCLSAVKLSKIHRPPLFIINSKGANSTTEVFSDLFFLQNFSLMQLIKVLGFWGFGVLGFLLLVL